MLRSTPLSIKIKGLRSNSFVELVAGHMAVNLVTNVQAALSILPHEAHCWLDSTVALYWIKGQGEYRQFVSNTVHKIQQHKQVKWQHVPTEDNPADQGSRGEDAVNSHLWKHGPDWLNAPSNWPPDIILEPTAETMPYQKLCESVRGCGDSFITAEIKQETEMTGPISTEEIQHQELWWIKQAQQASR